MKKKKKWIPKGKGEELIRMILDNARCTDLNTITIIQKRLNY